MKRLLIGLVVVVLTGCDVKPLPEVDKTATKLGAAKACDEYNAGLRDTWIAENRNEHQVEAYCVNRATGVSFTLYPPLVYQKVQQ